MTPIYLVDAFADGPFTGNPAGVCLLDGPAGEGWMQNAAAELNQAETAFVWPLDSGFSLRWFTPTVEVDLCGHATLASANVLWETDRLAPTAAAEFHTKSGLLVCTCAGGQIEMDFPAEPAVAIDIPEGLEQALGMQPLAAGLNRMDLLVQLGSEAEVKRLTPNLSAIQCMPYRGVIVTAASESPAYDFVSRFFAPAAGVPEDHATGSAHCCLGPWWAERLGRSDLVGYQASVRGAVIGVRLEGESRVTLRGRARTVMRGDWL
ncbi:MAG TPA: PhzF family phenazine biosynthesis protein [Fimbriimonadaceae bacterium]|nr:PhzF family phenazine biosynthesis protein [Fimbriimonadaceae bacterium]